MNESENTALFISPHLDDVVFSCGATLAKMSDSGWRTILCTVFTKSVADPTGFALECQLDKNLAPEIDYMKLRRSEDACAAKILHASEVLHLNFPEAPHRNYNSAAELFTGIKSGDDIQKNIAEHFDLLDEIYQPKIVFVPQGLGNHCDHLQTIDAALHSFDNKKICWYFDTPYAIRQPNAEKYQSLPPDLISISINISEYINVKIEACAAYKSQIGFQFGGRENLSDSLVNFHLDSQTKSFAESFLVKKPSETNLIQHFKLLNQPYFS